MTTIYKIASEAGVSVSTVARVLRNEHKGVRADSVERSRRIREIADRIGYKQSWRASAFAKGKTRGIGLLSEHSEWLFYGMMGQLAGELSQAFNKLGYHLVVIPMDSEGEWKELISGGRVDGLVVLHHYADSIRSDLKEVDIPLLVIGDSSAEDTPRLLYDDEGGAYAATRHLIELGHRHIAMYARDVVRPHCSVTERRRGFEAAMEEAGLDCENNFWCVPEEELLQRVVRSESKPSAVVCYCHVEAEVLYQLLWQNGLSVPRHLSVVAFNDLPSTERMSPPLSTIGFDSSRLAVLASKILTDLLEGKKTDTEDLIVRPSLNLRASTASPESRDAKR